MIRIVDATILRHYQDAYAMLVVMFGSTATLPPRTKRWAEAKVLADCISVKVGFVKWVNVSTLTFI
jgi:trafficking protein particle complex subunit 11